MVSTVNEYLKMTTFMFILNILSRILAERTFRTREFYRELQDTITPAGLAFFQADWDSSVTDFFHKELGI